MARKHSKKKSGALGDLFPVFPRMSEEELRDLERSIVPDLGIEEFDDLQFERNLMASLGSNLQLQPFDLLGQISTDLIIERLRSEGQPDTAQERLKDHLKFPALLDAPDEKFLGLSDYYAGRKVCIVLCAISDTREHRERAWKCAQALGVNLGQVGRAAKMLERLNINWRELKELEDVLQAAHDVSELEPAH